MRTSIIYLFSTTYTIWVFYLAVMNLATAKGRFFSTIIGSGMLFFSNLTIASLEVRVSALEGGAA
jgi:hypothetical protein